MQVAAPVVPAAETAAAAGAREAAFRMVAERREKRVYSNFPICYYIFIGLIIVSVQKNDISKRGRILHDKRKYYTTKP